VLLPDEAESRLMVLEPELVLEQNYHQKKKMILVIL
jgi:hypothetical protein